MSGILTGVGALLASVALTAPVPAARHHRNHAAGASRHRGASARSERSDAGNCPGEAMTPNAADLQAIRSATMCLVNRQRTLAGERPLRTNGALQIAAQEQTESMVAHGYFSHLGPDGQTPAQRMRAAGYIPSGNAGYEVGENIAWGSLHLATPKAIVSAWMRSPEHRANILDAHYTATAIGVLAQLPGSVAGGAPGATYTQDFGVIIHG